MNEVLFLRSLIGVRFLHTGMDHRVGLDCLGLVRLCWEHSFGRFPVHQIMYKSPKILRPHSKIPTNFFEPYLKKAEQVCEKTQLVVFEMQPDFYHLGFVFQQKRRINIIHATLKNGVCEQEMNDFWRSKILHTYQWEVL